MTDRFSRFPSALATRARAVRLGGVPTLLAHPDWSTPAPVVIWMHGRRVSKELDPGRYLRWVRAGIAACAIDLPGHGERLDTALHGADRTPELIALAITEIDRVVEGLRDPGFGGAFDAERMGIGGMSAGGMVALRRLCDPHPFRCAAVEATTGDLSAMYRDRGGHAVESERVRSVDPALHLAGWRPIPLLALHADTDRLVPVDGMRGFIGALRERYMAAGAPPELVEFQTWSATGAPDEHSGFGRFSNEAKNRQTEFFKRHLG